MGELPPGERGWFFGIRMWLRVAGFFLRHPLTLLILAPLLFVPLLADALITALIAQERESGRLQPVAAVQRALRVMPAFIRLKLFYFARSVAWALIPIYGLIRDIDERLAWAMSSNVIMLEDRTDFATARARCEALVAQFRGECIRVLFTVPVTLMSLIFIALALANATWMFWCTFGALIFLVLPASAAANTYLYLWMRAAEEAQGAPLQPDTNPRPLEPTIIS